MKLLINHFRIWWQKPADITQRNPNREVSQLELFYDLVYVAIIIQLTHIVVGNISITSVLAYVSLFLMMFWAWFNGSLYHELHGNHDLKTRFVIFLQMICLIGMGIFIHSIFDGGYQGFAISYGLFLGLFTILWWRTGVHDVDHKPISQPFVYLFCLMTIAFFVSVFTPAKISYFIWIIAVFFSLIFTLFSMIKENKKAKAEQLEAIRNIGESFVERLGLLGIIILGEGVASIVSGSTHIHHWTILNILNVIGSFILLVTLWWIFFDFISRRLPKKDNYSKSMWLGLHFPLMASLGLIDTGILNLLEYVQTPHLADKLVLIIPIIIFLLSCIGLMKVIKVSDGLKFIYKNADMPMILAIVGLLILLFLPINTTILIWLSIACLLAPIYSAFLMWIEWKSEETIN
ncbi:low temperature requirement protein A [Pasteurella atlantica]|uniref:Low temperature requirement protein A n=2 Tax=Pasteurellaceae TaxID=712 RepID=A0ACC6HNH5_9PAST|nr:low temperature requirement protein A [Pasteurella atlantica]MDP8033688.1 low temperature requirement protein A [Pasteurella atlantica]MDP8035532.1 low temperature requirement protein A [Pasteurella atlantica]MDP8037483.1 low temperature requirement protein A [Pasteurella atlantica]MDP8047832.1 low temperature requirement protein A [Pasteurella atlantica]MDP8049787.1 low temperature requirement protein A [Pasteurella atlantica]